MQDLSRFALIFVRKREIERERERERAGRKPYFFATTLYSCRLVAASVLCF